MSDFETYFHTWRDRCRDLDGLDKLFVVGCAKSGTTWLENLLQGHPEVHIRGEGRYFWSLAQNMHQAFAAFNNSLPATGPANPAWWSEDEFACMVRLAIEAELTRSIESSPAKPDLKVVGDKTPMHTLAVDKLHALFPTAKFIHIIRDPRDATISQWFFWAKDHDPRPFEAFVEYSITEVWPMNVASARNAGKPLGDLYTEVRYEDLLANTADEMRRLAGFLGVDTANDAIGACLNNGDFSSRANGRKRGTDGGEGSLYRKGVAGDWANHIPPDLAQRCCAKVGTLMRSLGYNPNQTVAA